ncbi:hypothetical protein Asppvi_009838 [Aspergillus pseudoviridinutans]|uniref:Uncharacterized protein n=1 Tax=Aspergillus pseudoviridinutans TaxID=1517512 RepID=A0A9P3BM50_9EURO|nr:uncharacterized protein Asppvi_009838 [Aspergillus pseudoviridinutans]GIJ90873.1 hypothetical protein Asppvi_009838 [Aspergillus pseudoviridinutans]
MVRGQKVLSLRLVEELSHRAVWPEMDPERDEIDAGAEGLIYASETTSVWDRRPLQILPPKGQPGLGIGAAAVTNHIGELGMGRGRQACPGIRSDQVVEEDGDGEVVTLRSQSNVATVQMQGWIMAADAEGRADPRAGRQMQYHGIEEAVGVLGEDGAENAVLAYHSRAGLCHSLDIYLTLEIKSERVEARPLKEECLDVCRREHLDNLGCFRERSSLPEL